MKLITFAVPCYNSAAYMDHCIKTLLEAGDEAEIILVDDGSTDDTPAIADRYAEQYPDVVRVIHQPNGGHVSLFNSSLVFIIFLINSISLSNSLFSFINCSFLNSSIIYLSHFM